MMLLGIFGFIALALLAVVVLIVISLWKMFEKAGEPGWYCLIPVFNGIKLLQIAGIPMYLILTLIAAGVAMGFASHTQDETLKMVIGIVSFAENIFVSYCVSRAFNGGAGLTVLTAFLPFIAYPIMGFSSEYVGFWQTAGSGSKRDSSWDEYDVAPPSSSNPFQRPGQPTAAATAAASSGATGKGDIRSWNWDGSYSEPQPSAAETSGDIFAAKLKYEQVPQTPDGPVIPKLEESAKEYKEAVSKFEAELPAVPSVKKEELSVEVKFAPKPPPPPAPDFLNVEKSTDFYDEEKTNARKYKPEPELRQPKSKESVGQISLSDDGEGIKLH